MMIPMQRSSLIAIVCLLLLGFLGAKFTFAMEVGEPAEIRQSIDAYMKRSMKANHIGGAALAISRNQEVFYAQGYGAFADGRSITGDTPFPIASLSKSFTALAVLQLADQGRMDLDAAYVSYFPELLPRDPRVRNITVRHLLNHTSGLNDKVNPDMTRAPQFQSLQEANRLLNNVQLARDPGAAYSYHNPNYTLLASLVETVSGEPFAAYLNRHLFVPLGMKHTFTIGSTQQINGNEAIPPGHYLILGRAVVHAEPPWFVDGPAGVVSTAADMSRWMRAQYDGQLLSPALMEQYHAAGVVSPYGLGWLAGQDEAGGRTISHSGIFWTYKSEETIYLDERLGIAVMFDSGLNAFVNYRAFVDDIARLMRGEKPEPALVNGRNGEMFMLALILATLGWGVYVYSRIRKRTERLTRGKWIRVVLGRAFPFLLLVSLSPLASLIGGGRVLPWFGIWITLPSLILWLGVWSAVNGLHLACYSMVHVRHARHRQSGKSH